MPGVSTKKRNPRIVVDEYEQLRGLAYEEKDTLCNHCNEYIPLRLIAFHKNVCDRADKSECQVPAERQAFRRKSQASVRSLSEQKKKGQMYHSAQKDNIKRRKKKDSDFDFNPSICSQRSKNNANQRSKSQANQRNLSNPQMNLSKSKRLHQNFQRSKIEMNPNSSHLKKRGPSQGKAGMGNSFRKSQQYQKAAKQKANFDYFNVNKSNQINVNKDKDKIRIARHDETRRNEQQQKLREIQREREALKQQKRRILAEMEKEKKALEREKRKKQRERQKQIQARRQRQRKRQQQQRTQNRQERRRREARNNRERPARSLNRRRWPHQRQQLSSDDQYQEIPINYPHRTLNFFSQTINEQFQMLERMRDQFEHMGEIFSNFPFQNNFVYFERNDSDEETVFEEPEEGQGLTPQEIDMLPTYCYQKKVGSDDQCTVCLNSLKHKDVLRRLPCQHCFHTGCIDEWLSRKSQCPMCRQDIAEALR